MADGQTDRRVGHEGHDPRREHDANAQNQHVDPLFVSSLLVSRPRGSTHISPALDDAGGVRPPRNTRGMSSSAFLASLADSSPRYTSDLWDGTLATRSARGSARRRRAARAAAGRRGSEHRPGSRGRSGRRRPARRRRRSGRGRVGYLCVRGPQRRRLRRERRQGRSLSTSRCSRVSPGNGFYGWPIAPFVAVIWACQRFWATSASGGWRWLN